MLHLFIPSSFLSSFSMHANAKARKKQFPSPRVLLIRPYTLAKS